MALRTALYDKHVELGGKMVEFCGYMLPVQYAGIMDEHRAVRGKAGLFDVSHMARLDIEGGDGEAFLQRMITNDISNLAEGGIRYTFVCNEQGGVRDDVLVYRRAGLLSLVVNAANAAKIKQHLQDHLQGGVQLVDRTGSTGHIALQGPDSEALMTGICRGELPRKYYSFAEGLDIAGVDCFVSRNGYTGEDGFEIICAAESIADVYSAIMDTRGVAPCGLGCRDTLRLEAGMPLYGHELDEDISPIEAGLSMFVKVEKGMDFIGRAALAKQLESGAPRKRIGIKMLQRGIARQDCEVFAANEKVGRVTSGSFCPTLDGNYAMALVDDDCVTDGLQVSIRGRLLNCERVDIPFYRRQHQGNAD